MIIDPSRPPKPYLSNQCLACQTKPGKPKYGIVVCEECDDRVFIKPYGGYMQDRTISSISLTVKTPHPKYDRLEVIYRFHEWDTLISAMQGTLSFPLLILPGIQPMTEEFLESVPKKLNLWLTFS